jgi:hypothetical protein
VALDALDTAIGGDQSEGLPEIGSFLLFEIEPVLKGREDFDYWLDTVTSNLRGHSLHRLINKDIKKPARNSVNAE